MTDSRRQKLINLGPHALADALLILAVHSDEADDLLGLCPAAVFVHGQRNAKQLSVPASWLLGKGPEFQRFWAAPIKKYCA